MKSLNRLKIGLLIVAMAGSGFSAAGSNHYRWLNERGEPVFSDRPPPKGVDYEVVSSQSSLKRNVSAEEGAVPPETQSRAGNEFDQIDTAAVELSKKNAELCKRAEMNLIALNSADKVNVRNDQGELRELSPQEMELARQTAKAQMSVYCE